MYSHLKFSIRLGFLFSVLSTLVTPRVWAAPSLDDEVSVSASEESFIESSRPPSARAQATRLSTRIRMRNDAQIFGSFIDMGGSFDPAVANQTNFEVPEAYVSWTKRDRVDAPEPTAESESSRFKEFVGRKKENWSELDSYWTLGIVQPLNRFDSLRPTEQGLPGAFSQFTWDNVQLMVFASPVFIPEQGPNYQLDNGQFSTSNAWFTEPTDHVKLISQSTPLHYQIDTPSIGSIITHPSGGLLFRAGDLMGSGWLVQLGYTKKPRNQLSLPFTGTLVTDANNPYASITLSPQVAYHNVGTMDLTYKTESMRLGLSLLSDVADSEQIPAGLVGQTFDPAFMISPNLQFRLGRSEKFTSFVRVSTLTTFGGDAHLVTNSDLSVQQNPFSPRYMYKQAASLEFRGRFLQSRGWIIDSGIRWIEEYSEAGTIVMSDLLLVAPANWQVGLYVDLLASRLPENENPGFISRFRANDRAGMKLSYLF